MSLEHTILEQLIFAPEYADKVIPHLKLSYFEERDSKLVIRKYVEYFQKYNQAPSVFELASEIETQNEISENDFDGAIEFLSTFEDRKPSQDWLLDKTEEWCKDRAIYLAINKAISIADGDDPKNLGKNAIPSILEDALAVSFNPDIGHDYLEDAEERHEFYQDSFGSRVPFGIKMLDAATNGGVPLKTLNVVQGGTNIGKTMFMCALAANYMRQGFNVAYFTMEMAREWIGNRIDANLMNMEIAQVEKSDREVFMGYITRLRQEKNFGSLKIMEYGTGEGDVNKFKSVMKDWRRISKFEPSVVLVDYIGIMDSVRTSRQVGSYQFVKSIAEELRAFAKLHEVAVWTGIQTNKEGYKTNDPDVTSGAESFGVPATSDFYMSLVRNDELDALGQIIYIQNKSRYGSKNDPRYGRGVLGVNAVKAQVYDADTNAQLGVNTMAEQPEPRERHKKKSKFADLDM